MERALHEGSVRSSWTSVQFVFVEDKGRFKAGHQPILTRGMNVQVPVDLINYQSMPDGPFKYVLDHQDHEQSFASCALS